MYRHQPESGTDITRIRSRSRDAIASVFTQVVIILGREGLIGREMFAIDGVKLPPNAFKYRSATRDEFIDQAQKLDGRVDVSNAFSNFEEIA